MRALPLIFLTIIIFSASCGTESNSGKTQSDKPNVTVQPCTACQDSNTATPKEPKSSAASQLEQSPLEQQSLSNKKNKADIKLPEAIIVRVPVDESGNEESSKIELRLVQTDSNISDQLAIQSAWDNATAVSHTLSTKNVDKRDSESKEEDNTELENSSSTASWYFYPRTYGWGGWNYPWHGFAYRYWPTYGYYGNYYYYNTMPYLYYNYGYNYYYYPRPMYWW